MTNNCKPETALEYLLARARAHGADAADAVFFQSSGVHIATRRQAPEGVERAESTAAGLRVWVGARQAVASSNDFSKAALSDLAERVVAMARAATDDHDSTLAPDALLARETADLDLEDREEPGTEWLTAQCRTMEEVALATPGVTNSEGAEAGYVRNRVFLMSQPVTGGGFARGYAGSHCSFSVSVLAGEGAHMERDWCFSSARHRADLLPPETIGATAAARAVARLNPRKVPTAQVPVVFEPRVARSLLSAFASAINGAAVTRGTSFLKDAMGTRIFPADVQIVDDACRVRGLASRPFDAEGVRSRRLNLVQDGVLQSWLLDVRTAARLGLSSTGHASRGVASAPSPSATNLFMEPGTLSEPELLSDIVSGFYVTDVFGSGVSLVTGDYSQGASGFWIEKGRLAYPVSEVTVAGNLKEMFARLTPANNLEFHYTVNAPSVRIDGMTVAGL